MQITVDLKMEDEDADVDTREPHDDVATPSSPLSEPPSPKPFDNSDVLPALRISNPHDDPSDSEDDAEVQPQVIKKRKSPSGSESVARKKMRVDSVSPAPSPAPAAGDVDAHEEDDSDGEETKVVRNPVSRSKGAGRGRGKGRGRRRGARAATARNKQTSVPDVSEAEDEDQPAQASSRPHLPTPSLTPDHEAEAETSKPQPRSRKQGKRRATSPPLSDAESRPASPAPSHRDRERSKAPSRKWSKNTRQRMSPFVDWESISPLPVPELEGMIIETLATSRATSLSSAALWDALVRARPALKNMGRRAIDPPPKPEPEHGSTEDDDMEAQEQPDTSPLNKREWLQLLTYILTAGHLSSGVFGRVDSSASDSDSPSSPTKKKRIWGSASTRSEALPTDQLYEIARSKPAQRAQWFYIPEKDTDSDRAALVKSMMRGPGKRSETMKYKRYYWKPLGKISRWDREDDL